jgi:predicted RNase H-like HicB family nuclease
VNASLFETARLIVEHDCILVRSAENNITSRLLAHFSELSITVIGILPFAVNICVRNKLDYVWQFLQSSDEKARVRPTVRQVKIIVEKHPDGYVAYPLGVKGVVVGEGDSYEEALADATSAIRFHVETFGPEILEIDPPIIEAFVAEVRLES